MNRVVYIVLDSRGSVVVVYDSKDLAIKHCQVDKKCGWMVYCVNSDFPPAQEEEEFEF